MLLTYDEGPTSGLGHRRRVQALASALNSLGIRTLQTPTAAEPMENDAIFVDSYDFRADDASMFRGKWIGAIDDLARDMSVDFLVEPAGAARSVARARERLIGLDSAILDPAIAAMRSAPIEPTDDRVLVTGGASDLGGALAAVTRDLAQRAPDTNIRIVGAPHPDLASLRNVTSLGTLDGILEEIAAAAVVLTAAGVTMLESLALGRPVVAVVAAENQRRYAEVVDAQGAAVITDAEHAADAVCELLRDTEARGLLATRARTLVDGKGAVRVAERIVLSAQLAGAIVPHDGGHRGDGELS